MSQDHRPPHAGSHLTIHAVQPQLAGGLAVRSTALDAEGRIDSQFSADGENVSPPLSWNLMPEAESFALVVEDPDAPGDTPFLHWLIWDIPGDCAELPRGVSLGANPHQLPGAVQGRNDAGTQGWYGPKPPVGHGVHHYHFQLFALGKRLGMGPENNLMDVLNALKGNTLASGELVGLFENPDPVADARSPGRTGSYGVEPSNTHQPPQHDVQGRGGLDRDDPDLHAPHTPDGEVRRRSGEG